MSADRAETLRGSRRGRGNRVGATGANRAKKVHLKAERQLTTVAIGGVVLELRALRHDPRERPEDAFQAPWLMTRSFPTLAFSLSPTSPSAA